MPTPNEPTSSPSRSTPPAPSGSGADGLFKNPYFARRVPELDGLRGIAILLVVVWHYVAIALPPPSGPLGAALRRPLLLAWSGVDLFFVLSGFLIGGILLDVARSPRYFTTFYARRFHRIFPLYYLFLVTFFVGCALVGPSAAAHVKKLFNLELPPWCYPLYLQNVFMTTRQTFGGEWVGVTWSLAIEEQFYLLLPLAVRALRPKTLALVVAAAVVAAPALRLALTPTNPFFGPYTLLPCRADALGLGVLAALVTRTERGWAFLHAHRRALVYALGPLFVGVVFLTGHAQGRLMNGPGYTWLAAFYACVLLLSVVEPGPVARAVLRSRLLQELGVVAYGVYLLHMGVNAAVHAAFLGAAPKIDGVRSLAATALAALVTFVVAKLSWRFFEKPLVARGQARFRYDGPTDRGVARS
ncbi:MAG TPA: acyltransferase [Minicystis sp.]|nr:acyltransferase [Minicystis sp.]